MTTRKELLRGARIDPKPVSGRETVGELVDNAFPAYNACRLREGCRLYNQPIPPDRNERRDKVWRRWRRSNR